MANTEYTLNFTNGICSGVELPVGTYSYVRNTIKGYDGGWVDSFTVTPTTTDISIEIAANGILTVNVKDKFGTSITEGDMVLADANHSTTYGTPVQIVSGVAIFSNVPNDSNGLSLYLAQNSSDSRHYPLPDPPKEINMNQPDVSVDVLNELKPIPVTINMSDKYYRDITEITGSVVVNSTD